MCFRLMVLPHLTLWRPTGDLLSLTRNTCARPSSHVPPCPSHFTPTHDCGNCMLYHTCTLTHCPTIGW